MVPDGDDTDSSALASAVPVPGAAGPLVSIRPMDMLTIALSARGTTYGALTIAQRAGTGFDADGRGVPRGLRAPGRGHPGHHPRAGRVAAGRRRALARPDPADGCPT